MKRIEKKHRKSYSKIGKKYVCGWCLYAFDSKEDCLQHLEDIHGIFVSKEKHENIPYKNVDRKTHKIFMKHFGRELE